MRKGKRMSYHVFRNDREDGGVRKGKRMSYHVVRNDRENEG